MEIMSNSRLNPIFVSPISIGKHTYVLGKHAQADDEVSFHIATGKEKIYLNMNGLFPYSANIVTGKTNHESSSVSTVNITSGNLSNRYRTE